MSNNNPDQHASARPNNTADNAISEFTPSTLFSRGAHNKLVRRLNALMRMNVSREAQDGPLRLSDSNAILPLANEVSGGGSGSGNMNYRGLYSAAVDYAVDDVVYTGSTPAQRYFYVAEVINGPGSAIVTPDPTEAGGSPTWRLIAAPPGSLQKMTITSVSGDYIVCTDAAGHTGIKVAKPPMLRASVASRVINSITFTYSSYSGNTRSVTSSSFSGALVETIEPEYQTGDIIFAEPVDHSGVTVSAVELPLIDANLDKRGWTMEYGQ